MLELVHFQITKNCNLRCWFCGQWGKKGFFADDKGTLVTLAEWKRVIESIKRYGAKVGKLPDIMLWGGEPLVSPIFDELALYLKDNGFKIGMVTNGVLLNEHIGVVNGAVSVLYVSLDGYRETHDAIRGKGVYDKVISNLRLVDSKKVKIRVMSVTSDATVKDLVKFTDDLSNCHVEKLILQDRIALKKSEADEYAKWLKESFGLPSISVYGYVDESYTAPDLSVIDFNKLKVKVEHNAQGVVKNRCCYGPNKHAHIAWNGNVLFCTDFFDFSAGNIKNGDLIDIFNSETAEKYRRDVEAGKCPTCDHCSWKNSETFYL